LGELAEGKILILHHAIVYEILRHSKFVHQFFGICSYYFCSLSKQDSRFHVLNKRCGRKSSPFNVAGCPLFTSSVLERRYPLDLPPEKESITGSSSGIRYGDLMRTDSSCCSVIMSPTLLVVVIIVGTTETVNDSAFGLQALSVIFASKGYYILSKIVSTLSFNKNNYFY
jgi:hypothetical protein